MDQKHRPNDGALETRMKGMMSYDLMETIRNTNEWMGASARAMASYPIWGMTPHPMFKVMSAWGRVTERSFSRMVIKPDWGIRSIPAASGQDHLIDEHVVVEKPLEISAQRCDQIINACQKHGVKLATIFGARFGDANRELKIAVDSGRFGRLTLAEAACKWWRSQEYYDNGGWKGTQALDGGGALMNQAIHVVDLLLWMMMHCLL